MGIKTTGACALLALAAAQPVLAQRTDDNAVTAAEDAFGTSVGDTQIGIYNDFDVRGFSPVDAGNVRIEGLYFDRQSSLTGRTQEGSTIRVGLSAQSYPFPAPTGIADYSLREPGKAFVASPAVKYGDYAGWQAEADFQVPIDGERLGFAGGAGIYRNREPWGGTPDFFSVGGVLRWAPAPGVEVKPFYSRIRGTSEEQQPLIFTTGAFLPKRGPDTVYLGQPWNTSAYVALNYGLLARAPLAGFDIRLGVFRSEFDTENTGADLLFDTDQTGRVGRRVIVRERNFYAASTSGEFRVTRSFAEGPRRHTLIAAVRGRQQDRRYGGAALVELGASRSDAIDNRPEPVTVDGPKTLDRVTQATFGVAYEGRWHNVGELSFGIQKTDYRKRVTEPAPIVSPPETKDSPWLINATAAIYVTPKLAIYGGYTRGLEESPVAPNNAVNLNEAPPAIRTEQKDAGIRWNISKGVTAVLGVFDIEKPYFNLDTVNRFRQLGTVRHRGVEFSIAGQIAPGLNLVAGNVMLDAEISGEEVARGVIGKRPIGTFVRHTIVSMDYRLPWFDPLSFDATFEQTSDRIANAANTLVIPERAVVHLGARYRMKIDNHPVLIRATVGNVTNTFGWNVGGSGFFVPNGARRYSLTIAADI
ncbi:MAG: TonB-dependent receptor [Pseudomonadota bacterium]